MTAPNDRPRWTVRRWRKTHQGIAWNVYEPDGSYSATFYAWEQAMDYATNVGTRVEHWLARQR